MKERNYEPFDVKKFLRGGEKLYGKGFIKTEGFEKTVAGFSLAEKLFRIMEEKKSFRLELVYDAKALNTNYCIFVSTDEDKGKNAQGSQDMKCPQLRL